jgi:hypothetical protein
MQTLGSLIDQLNVVNLKMWNAQESLYEVRKMTYEEFEKEFFNKENFQKLYNYFKNACDLNVQRNDLIDEIDETFAEIIVKVIENKKVDTDKLKRKKHKTY